MVFREYLIIFRNPNLLFNHKKTLLIKLIELNPKVYIEKKLSIFLILKSPPNVSF